MTITATNYLDLGNLLINELIGSNVLFLLMGVSLIVFLSIKYRLNFASMTGIVVIFVGATMNVYMSNLWFISLLLGVGLISYQSLYKVFGK